MKTSTQRQKSNQQRTLVLYLPVIHQGYLNLLRKNDNWAQVLVIDLSLVKKLSQFAPDLAALSAAAAVEIISSLGISNVREISHAQLSQLEKTPLLLIDDEIGRNLHQQYFSDWQVEWARVFLRWDRSKVFSSGDPEADQVNNEQDQKLITQAYQEAEKSSDWWRQVGAIAVVDGQVILKSYNQGIPTDHTPYIEGSVRDQMEVGEQPELANYIHAEQALIATAARKGISLSGADLYLTHFPCPVCAKLIAFAKFKNILFAEGSASLDGEQVLRSAGITIKKVTK